MGQVNYKPEGFHSVTPYLMVNGAARLLEFLKEAFDAEEIGRYLDPSGRIMHACVKIGDSMVELSDATEQWPPMTGAFHFYVSDVDAVFQRAIKAGGTSLQAPEDKFYGERSGGLTDICGNNWYVATRTEALTKDEIDKRSVKMASHQS